MDYFGIIISFVAALGLFLFGLKVLSSSLEEAAGPSIKRLLVKFTKTRFRGVLFGAGATALIQSSTAVTVMSVGFVNAGLITLTGVVGIIMGANIGTTIVSWFMASAEWNLNFFRPDVLGAAAVLIGASFLLFAKKEKTKSIAKVVAGFGILFVGLSSMPAAVRPLAELDVIRELFIMLSHNPLLSLLIGILVTALIQSSNASIGILQSMAMAGVIPWSAAVFIVLGQNVGTCFTTMLTSIGANKNTKAASFVHFIYNMMGAAIFGVGAFVYFQFINTTLGNELIAATNISMLHTGYNVLLLLVLFPLGNIILNLAIKMAGKEKPVNINEFEIIGLDESILETPEFALDNANESVVMLTDKLRQNMLAGVSIFMDHNFDEKSDNFNGTANEIDAINKTIRNFLTKLYDEKLNEEQNITVATLVQGLTSLKRISQHSRGVVKQAKYSDEENYHYSDEDRKKIQDILDRTVSCYNESVNALTYGTIKNAKNVLINADEIIAMRNEYKLKQRERVLQDKYNFEADVVFMEVLRHFAEIAKQTKSIAEVILNNENEAELLL